MGDENSCPECAGGGRAEGELPVVHVPMMTRPPAIGEQITPPGPARPFERLARAEGALPLIHVPMMTRPPAIVEQATPLGTAMPFERRAREVPLPAMDRVPVSRLPVTAALTGPSWLAESLITSGPLAGLTLAELRIAPGTAKETQGPWPASMAPLADPCPDFLLEFGEEDQDRARDPKQKEKDREKVKKLADGLRSDKAELRAQAKKDLAAALSEMGPDRYGDATQPLEKDEDLEVASGVKEVIQDYTKERAIKIARFLQAWAAKVTTNSEANMFCAWLIRSYLSRLRRLAKRSYPEQGKKLAQQVDKLAEAFGDGTPKPGYFGDNLGVAGAAGALETGAEALRPER